MFTPNFILKERPEFSVMENSGCFIYLFIYLFTMGATYFPMSAIEFKSLFCGNAALSI